MATRKRESGFTLIELMTVIAIVGILAGIAVPQFRHAIILAKEAVLREDLYRLRDLLEQYQADKGQYPEHLQTLVDEHYLRQLPLDPMTGRSDWVEEVGEPDPSNPGATPGVEWVHSASEATSESDGQPYSKW